MKRLVWLALFLSVGCSKKGVLGVELGASVEAAKAALAPVAGAGNWKLEQGDWVYRAEGGAPHRVLLTVDDDKVVGVRMFFADEPLAAAGKNPKTFRYDITQPPKSAVGPFDHGPSKVWITPTVLHTRTIEGDVFQTGRYDRAGIGAAAASCDDAQSIADSLEQGVHLVLGEEGARMGTERDAAIFRMLLLAAAADLSCEGSSGVLTAVASFLAATAQYNGAIERYKKALTLDTAWGNRTPSDAHAGVGAVSFRFGRADDASEHYRAGLQKAKTPAKKAKLARSFADDLHDHDDFGTAAKYYQIYLDNLSGGHPGDTQRVYARLARAYIQIEGGCKKSGTAVESGLTIEGGSDRSRAQMLAAQSFQIIACEPKKKKQAYAVLEEAVKLDPLMSAEWARLAAYYDREATDDAILEIMVDQGWVDKTTVDVARKYQQQLRGEAR